MRSRGIPCAHHALAVRLDIALNPGTCPTYHERQRLLEDIAAALVDVDTREMRRGRP
jgi:hypothetical protein